MLRGAAVCDANRVLPFTPPNQMQEHFLTLAIRTLRRSRALTLTDLALLTGIPARTIAEIEHGLRQSDRETTALLALVFGMAPEALLRRLTSAQTAPPGAQHHLALLAAGTVAIAALSVPLVGARPEPQARRAAAPVVAQELRAVAASSTPVAPSARPTPPLLEAAPQPEGALAAGRVLVMTAVPTPAPAFQLLADGPHGCPLLDTARVVVTQGYGVGTHAPAKIWGALDLALDADGDGVPEPGSTAGAAVVATHAGVARLYPDSWPGGNVVMVELPAAGWVTLYAHLSAFSVVDGAQITAGTLIGRVGSTGQASGPHLHYEVRGRAGNVDPAALIGCV